MPENQNFFKKFFIPSLFILASTPAKAQITPDNTLGTEASTITPNTLINGANADLINGGAQRGSNLFHSFTEFNINDGQRVYFGNPSGVQNILTRVTGGNASNILGTLGVNGIANLFLINPNGIVFGNNASLDIRGSFIGTTANAVQFGNRGIFSATNPQAPPLLTVNPSALLFNQINQNATIQNNSIVPVGTDPAGVNVFGLRVPDGKSLLLVGGNVSMDGGWAIANGGRIELGGLKAAGSIEIQTNGDIFSLSFPDGVQRGDISLNNKAIVGVIGGGGGSISANAQNIEILAGSEFFAGIGSGLGTTNTQAGDITVDATGQIKLAGTDTLIFNSVQSQAVGNAGKITIKTGSLEVTDGAQINSFTRGQGNAGNITIQARDAITFDGVDSNGFPSGVFSNVATGGVGNGGNIGITSGSLSITNGGNIQVAVREASDTLLGGQGIGGTVNINVRDAVTISGASSTIFGSLGTGAIGSAGDIKVEAENVLINDGGEISSSTFGQGDSGNIFITARDAISLDAASYIYNNVQSSDAVGNAGNIDIITGSLSLTNGAQINSFTRGQGNAGNITITARDTVTFDGQDSNSNQSGLFSVVGNDAVGNGGTVSITSGSLSLNNGGRFGIYVSDTSDALQGKKAIGGTANINVRDAFTISGEGSGIFASLGSGVVGAGGDVNIKAGNLLIQDAGEISSFLGYGAQGRGGDVSIQVGNLLIKNGGQINSSTFGQGDSGNIFITARDVISLDTASYIYNNVQSSDAVGNAGNIDITTGSLAVTNGAQINSFTRGIGNAGNINIQARDVVFVDGRGLLSSAVDSSAVGNAGKIDILTDSLSLTNGAQIVSSTLGKGDAGDITIQAKGTVIVDGFIPLNDKSSYFTVLLSNVGSGAVGNGGNIDITAGSLSLTNGGKLLVDVDKKTNTLPGGQGNAGNVNINVRDAFTISGTDSGIFGSLDAGAVGRGGNIKVQAGNVFIKDVGQIAAYTDGQGDAGNISITSRDAFSLDKSIIANLVLSGEAIGNAGKIDITTGSLSLTNGAQISSATRGRGNAGNITIQAKDRVTLDGFQFFDNESNTAYAGVFSDVNAGAIGNGGDISITAGSLSLTNGGQLGVGVDKKTNTLPGGQGIGGTVNINVRDAVTISGASSTIFGSLGTGAIGSAGDIKVEAENVLINDGGEISSSTFGQGDSGNIFITARDAISLDAASYIYNNVQSSDAVGNAGNIDIITGSLSLTNGAQINSFTRGQGNAGNITITARDTVTFDGQDSNSNQSGLFSVVGNDAVGNGGTVSITSGSLSLNNGGSLGIYVSDASDALQGKKAIGGTANINVHDAFKISGEGSGIFASLGSGVVGTGGNIKIKARNISIQDAGEMSSNNYGRGNAGNIDITTDSLNITNRAGIFAGTFDEGNGGNITVEARDLVEILSDSNLDSGVEQSARGNAGDVTIKTGRLIVRNSQIGPSTFGEGNAGNFKIIATDSVELSGQIPKREGDTSQEGSVGFPGGLLAQIDVLGKGRAGNLTIETNRLSVSDGSKIQAATFGDGDAGNIFIRADEIELFETEKPNFYSTGIFAGVQTDGRIDTGIIDPRNGRPPKGQGGNLTIETRTLSLRNGAEVFVQTTGEGDAGKIFIRASESVNVTGISTGFLERQRTSTITASASETSTGNGGSLTIETPLLNITDGGFISSSSDGKGIAGDINISGDITRLNNGKIIAQTASTDGGNINFNLSQYLLLRNGSQISTTAGTAQAGGNGGNITINTPFIVAAPNENSDITANAFSGAGGNINIFTQNIFGINSRLKPSPQTNDITASSELGVQGQIEIQQPEVQPTQELIQLPNEFIDASTKFSQICPRDPNPKPLGKFIVTGRGSLPPSPLESMTGTNIRIPLATLEEQTATSIDGIVPVSNNATSEIIEAQGMVKTATGEIALVTNAPQATPISRPVATVCPVSR